MNATRRAAWVVAVVLAVALAACSMEVGRPPTRIESVQIHSALERLWPGPMPDCVTIQVLDRLDVGGFGESHERPGCGVVELWTGSLVLAPEPFRAVVAHELAHVLLGHTWSWKSRRQAIAEEAAADRLGARLLLDAFGRSGCLALAGLYEDYARRGRAWQSPDHPPLLERARIVRSVCVGEPR